MLDDILRQLDELGRQAFRPEITWKTATIFIGSPNSLTPYHVDHEVNFLFRISGEKEVNLFEPRDRSVLTEEEIERFYVGDLNAARYREENQCKARVYRMTPGDAVHHPSLAPHWVRNGAQPTIALSVAFCMRPVDVAGRIYQVNHYLRRLGMKPSPAGLTPWKDSAKIAALGLLSTRSPKTEVEAVASGLERLRWPARAAKRWAKSIAGSHGAPTP